MDIDTLAQFFKALAEPVRLRILHLLLQQDEVCVCELVDSLELGQSVVSRHLAYLRNCNLVQSRREGAWMHYSISPDWPLDEVRTLLLTKMSQPLEQDLERLQQACGNC